MWCFPGMWFEHGQVKMDICSSAAFFNVIIFLKFLG